MDAMSSSRSSPASSKSPLVFPHQASSRSLSPGGQPHSLFPLSVFSLYCSKPTSQANKRLFFSLSIIMYTKPLLLGAIALTGASASVLPRQSNPGVDLANMGSSDQTFYICENASNGDGTADPGFTSGTSGCSNLVTSVAVAPSAVRPAISHLLSLTSSLSLTQQPHLSASLPLVLCYSSTHPKSVLRSISPSRPDQEPPCSFAGIHHDYTHPT